MTVSPLALTLWMLAAWVSGWLWKHGQCQDEHGEWRKRARRPRADTDRVG